MTDNDTSGELYITCTSRGKRTVRISIYLCSQSGYPPVKHHSYTYNNITYKPTNLRNYKTTKLQRTTRWPTTESTSCAATKPPCTTPTPPTKQNKTPNPSSTTSAVTNRVKRFITLSPGIRIRCVLRLGIKRRSIIRMSRRRGRGGLRRDWGMFRKNSLLILQYSEYS